MIIIFNLSAFNIKLDIKKKISTLMLISILNQCRYHQHFTFKAEAIHSVFRSVFRRIKNAIGLYWNSYTNTRQM